MKNFKLLLGATALLSTGLAMVANAVSSDTVNVSVKLFPMTTVDVVQQPDLGTIFIKGTGENPEYLDYTAEFDATISVNENGLIVSSDSSKVLIAKQATNGKLNVSCSAVDQSVFEQYIPINHNSAKLLDVKYKCVDDANHQAQIIATQVAANSNINNFVQAGGGEATGEFTVTTVY